GDRPEAVEHEAGHGLELRGLGQGDVVALAQHRRRHRALHDQRPVAEPLHRALFPVVLVLDVAHDLLDEVLERDEPGDGPVLVDHERHVAAALLQLLEERSDLLALGNELHRMQDLPDDDWLPLLEQPQRVLHVDEADHVVDVALVGRDAAEAALHDERAHLGRRRVRVEGEDLRARDHDLAHRHVRELEDAVDELHLALVEDALLAALLHEVLDLLLGHEGPRPLVLDAEEAKDEFRARGEEGDEPAGRPAQDREGPGDEESDALGVAQGKRLGDELSKDELHEHDADTDEERGLERGGDERRHPRALEEGLEVAGGEVPAEDAGERSHERHADLGGGEELVDVLLEELDALRSPAAFRDQGLDPAPARGQDRDLATREEAVPEQAENDRDCDEDRFGHVFVRWIVPKRSPCQPSPRLIAWRVAASERGERLANGDIFDVTVIGSGPGGYVAAIRAAQMGLKTAVVERDPAGCGGTCLQRGCIPTKALLHTADLLEDVRNGRELGIVAENVSLDFPVLMNRKDRIVQRLSKGIETYLFKKNKIQLFKGQGRPRGPETGVVEGHPGQAEVQTKNVILATGSRPRSIPGL